MLGRKGYVQLEGIWFLEEQGCVVCHMSVVTPELWSAGAGTGGDAWGPVTAIVGQDGSPLSS